MVTQKNLKILVIGQSNAAGFGTTNYTASHSLVGEWSSNTAHHYPYADPITWGDHDTAPNTGSIWGRVGDRLMETGFFSAIGFDVIAVGSSSVTNWDEQHADSNTPVRGYLCAQRLADALNDYTWDAVIWQQGEQDTYNGQSQSDHATALGHIIDKIRSGTSAPIFITLSSYAFGSTSNAVRSAQVDTVRTKAGSNVWLSFDMDVLVPSFKRRSDDVHLNEAGLIACANAWSCVLLPHLRGSF